MSKVEKEADSGPDRKPKPEAEQNPGFPSSPSRGSLSERGQEPPVVHCRGIRKRYRDVIAVAGIDLEVRRGECFGLLGPNGAGKTTTVEILEGINQPDEGVVELFGRRWGQERDREIRQRMGIQLQEARFPEKLTVKETVRLFRSFYEKGHSVDSLLKMVSLEEKRNARVGKLSGGQKQRLALACALAGDPELLFLDEPTTGLDPQARLQTWELIEGFRQRGVTVILTTHYMEEAERLCDRVAIMDRGKVIAQGPPLQLIQQFAASQVIEFQTAAPMEEDALRGLPGVSGVVLRNGSYRLSVDRASRTLPALLHELEKRNNRLKALTTHQARLEDVFITLTGRSLRDE